MQISTGVSNSTRLIKSWAMTPTTTAGRNATNTLSTKCRARALVGSATATDHSRVK